MAREWQRVHRTAESKSVDGLVGFTEEERNEENVNSSCDVSCNTGWLGLRRPTAGETAGQAEE